MKQEWNFNKYDKFCMIAPFNKRKKIEELNKFIWVKVSNYLLGLDEQDNKLYVFTPNDNFYFCKSFEFIFDETTKIRLYEEDLDYLIAIRTLNLLIFSKVSVAILYFNRIKIINSICS